MTIKIKVIFDVVDSQNIGIFNAELVPEEERSVAPE